jgi:uncharacterized protein YggL (DUF469 family)
MTKDYKMSNKIAREVYKKSIIAGFQEAGFDIREYDPK